jgi:2-phosphoglycerate kinase
MLAARLGYSSVSTDDIGQAIEAVTSPASHPALHRMAGQDYREYYVTRSIEQLVADAEERHAALWPSLQRVILAHAHWGTPIVMEGWALDPDRVGRLQVSDVGSVWLLAEDGLLEQRVRQCGFWRGASDEDLMIRRFLERSLICNARTRQAAERLGMPVVMASKHELPQALMERCCDCMGC